MLACYSEWWPYTIKDHIIITLVQFFVCFISMQRRILTFTSLNHFSSLVRGWKNRGVGRASDGSRRYTLNVLWWVEKRLVWDWQDTHFRGLRKSGAKIWFLNPPGLHCPVTQVCRYLIINLCYYWNDIINFQWETNWENIIISITINHNLIKDFLESLTWLLTRTEPFPRSRTISTSTYMANLLTRMITTW